jgi:hypothetical protein
MPTRYCKSLVAADGFRLKACLCSGVCPAPSSSARCCADRDHQALITAPSFSAVARGATRALVEALEQEYGGGAPLSEAKKALIVRAAGLQFDLEQMDAQKLEGAAVDHDQAIRMSSEHRRVLSALEGMTEKTKPGGATALAEYLAQKHTAAEADAESEDEAEAVKA